MTSSIGSIPKTLQSGSILHYVINQVGSGEDEQQKGNRIDYSKRDDEGFEQVIFGTC